MSIRDELIAVWEKPKKNEVVCIDTKATTQEETCDTSISKITIKTGKVILTIENGITKEILSFLDVSDSK